MAEIDRDQVISMLRACLMSLKGGIPVGNLDRDYKMLVGSRIPYQRLGYQTLEQFLRSVPDVTISRGHDGEMILNVIPSKSTEHLAALVSKQKSASKKHKAPSRYVPPRRTAASLWRPPLSAVSVRTSRRSSRANVHKPLCVTVNNNPDCVKCHSKTDSRVVSYARSSPEPQSPPQQPAPSSNASNGIGGGKHSYQAFEKPPRFLRLSKQENIPSAEPAPDPAPKHTSIPVAPVPRPVVSFSKAQERLMQAVSMVENSAENKNLNGTEVTNSGAASNTCNVTSPRDRIITSPLTPLHARLNAAGQKTPKVQVMLPLDEKFAGVSLGGDDFIKQLDHFAMLKGMGKPTYKIIPRMSNGKPYYSCSVKINDISISSYPDERSSPGEAMHLVAKQAVEELYSHIRETGGGGTQDENTIMTRILHIVRGHRSGIWSTQIPIDYCKLYNENLPDDWLTIMGRCPLVSLENVCANRTIITPKWAALPTESTIPGVKASELSMEASHSQPSMSPIQPSVPEPITLPQEDVWDMYITCGSSTNEIWGRLIGEEYSVKYENLATDMEMFYMGQVNVAADPEIGLFYAVKMDDCWHRVELVEIKETHTEGRVFFIDHGDEEDILLNQLHTLEQCFAKLPAQAICCFLWGLEEFADDPNVAHHITDTIVGRTLVASVKSLPNPKKAGVGIVLFDTSTDEDLNMNTVLIENITKDAIAPRLPPEGKVQEVYISHVTDAGDVFLQFESYDYLHSLLCNVIETGIKQDMILKDSNAYSPDPSRLYLARYHEDGNWYRAAITKKLNGQKEVEVIFVDFGNTELINPSELVLLETLKKSVAEFPHQAIKVHLHNVPSFSERMALRVRELVPFDECVLVKTVSTRTPNGIPVVEIFKRIQPDSLLVSINSTLAFDPDLKPQSKSDTDDGNHLHGKKRLEHLQTLALTGLKNCQTEASSSGNNTAAPQRLSPLGSESHDDASTSRGLCPPQIPDIGDYFDVHVTMAANPGNFTVQPYKDALRLEKMMEDMQTQYVQQTYSHLSPDSIQEGGLYAALHHDGHWYRVCVSNVISGSAVSVYFCDYGDVSVLPIDKLQPLTSQFKDLPYQAIKAKLAGVQPKHSDWSVEDCLMFQELVVEREFVSVIMETSPDLLNPTDMVIGLKLIDTSGEDDIYVDKLLISEDRAIMTTVS